MKQKLTLTILAMMLALGAKGAWADGPFPTALTDGTYGGPVGLATPNSNTNEVEIYNAVNLLLGSSYSSNAQLGSLEFTGNASTWQQSSAGAYAFIGLGAGATNTLDVYNPATPGTLINPLGEGFTGDYFTGNGTQANPYPATGLVATGGSSFGLALSSTTGAIYYSDPTLNPDGYDHMLAYNLSALGGTQIWVFNTQTNTEQLVTLNDPYLLAFEDSSEVNNGATSDMDYNDMMVLVDGASPLATVPEPMTLALFGVGLLAIAGFTLRKNQFPMMMA
jgi:hypothetical protein